MENLPTPLMRIHRQIRETERKIRNEKRKGNCAREWEKVHSFLLTQAARYIILDIDIPGIKNTQNECN